MNNTYKRLDALILPALVVLVGCIVDPPLKPDSSDFVPEVLADGWEVSTPSVEGVDSLGIAQVYENLFSESRYPTVRSLLVAKNGKLVAEGYSRDPRDRDRFHHVQSVTKSVTSLLVGIAMADGLAESLDTPLYDLMPEYFDDAAAKRAITLRHVLTMKTGLQFENDEDAAWLMFTPGSSIANVLGRPLVSDPGAAYYYSDGNPQLLSGAIENVFGVTLDEYGRERLFGPLGIVDFQWERHADGLNFGAFGLWLRPRDMAKIGQLLLQDGAWDGRQVVPSEWLDEATRVYANGNYGHYWWVAEENQVYSARGSGGQIIAVDERYDLVIVLTGDPNAKSWVLSQGIDELFSGIYQALETQ
jgi:CubicO group peptidase (beta-lactamase class C family)